MSDSVNRPRERSSRMRVSRSSAPVSVGERVFVAKVSKIRTRCVK